jgi:hypothetical protein
MVILVGCTYMPIAPSYNPPVTPIATTPLTPVAVSTTIPIDTATPTPTLIVPKVISLSAADHSSWKFDTSQSGIGKALHQIEFNTVWLKTRDLVAIDISPIYNAKEDDSVFSLTYGIYEQKDIPVMPTYFKDFVSTYSLVDVPGRSWADVPTVIDIPQGTDVPIGTYYFNIAIHDTGDTGSIQFQGAERWEITFK